MALARRNTITREQSQLVAAVAAAAGFIAALAGAEPTGETVPDVVLCFTLAAFVTWLGAAAPWWALVSSSAIVTVASSSGPVLLTVLGSVAMLGGLWLGWRRSSRPLHRAAIAGVVVQVALRLEIDGFFLESTILAGASMALLAVSGWIRHPRYIRKRVLWALAGAAAAALLAGAGVGVAAAQARGSATEGYQRLLDGLKMLERGENTTGVAEVLRDAASRLGSAGDDLDGFLAQPSRLLPVAAQNRSAGERLLHRAADAADAAAATLDLIDLDRLSITNGVIDVDAVAVLAEPFADLEATVTELHTMLEGVDTNWLIPQLQDKIHDARARVARVQRQAVGSSAAAEVAPAMLGRDGPRRYFFAFTNPAEARGMSGLMGNWSEVTITNGRLEVTASGRTAQLGQAIRGKDVFLAESDEYFTRYKDYGSGSADEPVHEKFWSNATMPPDMPSVGSVMAQLYQAGTGTTVDGVFVIDPAGLAALLDATGPVVVEGIAEPLSAANVEQFLLVDQYQRPEAEREDILEAFTKRTIDHVLSSTLPPPQQLAAKLGPAALEGHISVWASRTHEQTFLETIGIDNALPGAGDPNPSYDGLAVVTNNASGNKVDSFLERATKYTAEYDPRSGEVNATLVVTLHNTAPTTGYPDYVIGNIIGAPIGTNRTMLSIYSRLGLASAEVDGAATSPQQQIELGWNVYTQFVDVPSGQSVTVTIHLAGPVAAGGYELVYRPQALPVADTLEVTVTTPAGNALVSFDGTLERRSIIGEAGVSPFR